MNTVTSAPPCSGRGRAATAPACVVVPGPRHGQAAAPKASTVKSAGHKPGATGYTNTDLMEMLHLVHEVLPLGPDEWATIVVKFNKNNHGQWQLRLFHLKWDAVSTLECPIIHKSLHMVCAVTP